MNVLLVVGVSAVVLVIVAWGILAARYLIGIRDRAQFDVARSERRSQRGAL